ncbi:MAG: NAD(P)-dependent glycerol-3-phosphate dehydrogenase [Firmicutes bacterium]|nr:NAD(P)-dependent glycerol-3-phosphate dehydrogenase [Bacillota bacterium]
MNATRRAAVVPAGAWGTALAMPLAANGFEVRLWMRRADAAAAFLSSRTHPHLPGAGFPPGVLATADLAEAIDGADLVVLAAPSRALREVLAPLRPLLGRSTMLVSVTKGIEPDSLLRMSQVVAAELPDSARLTVLSGPNFAIEVARRQPTATVVAGRDSGDAAAVQEAFMTRDFRVYPHNDLGGVELGGALKNVIALAVGIADGLGVGHNARAALITRGLAEMARLGVALGAHPLTFAGLAGMGDLVLTCTGDYSRNRRAGLAVGRGEPLERVVASLGVVEGVPTTRAALTLARQRSVPMPVTEQVHRVLYEGVPPREGVMALMARERASEHDAPAPEGPADLFPDAGGHLSLYLKKGSQTRPQTTRKT